MRPCPNRRGTTLVSRYGSARIRERRNGLHFLSSVPARRALDAGDDTFYMTEMPRERLRRGLPVRCRSSPNGRGDQLAISAIEELV